MPPLHCAIIVLGDRSPPQVHLVTDTAEEQGAGNAANKVPA